MSGWVEKGAGKTKAKRGGCRHLWRAVAAALRVDRVVFLGKPGMSRLSPF